ncbi:MAG: DNA polymerase/3'-5' exonuclease PolX [Actinomycetota bacterium]
MTRANEEVESLLVEYADLLSIASSDPHKPRAYEKAARAIGGYHADIAGMDEKQLKAIPNVGSSIAQKVLEQLRTGTIRSLEELRAEIPSGVRQLTAIPGLGPKTAVMLFRERGISAVEELSVALEDGSLEGLKGFGDRTVENVRRGIRTLSSAGDRVKIGAALSVAEELLAELRTLPGVERCGYAGSLRRMRETIGDVDLLVASADSGPVMDAFASSGAVERVIARGETKTSIRTRGGIQVDLRVIAPNVWGAALQYFTGSKAHNVRIREIAVRKGLKLSEYGVFVAESGELLASETEDEVYAELGLPFIPPTLREDRGEVQAAQQGTLPDVVELSDIRGDLHTHTDLTDGLAPLERMVATAKELGYAYYAVTDHAPNLYMQRMSNEKMLDQRAQLGKLKTGKMTLLHGTELNIDPDGGVDWPEAFLDGFDVCVASVHSHFNQSREELTRRVIRAMEHPNVNIIGHLTGRKIGHRPPLDLDLDAVFDAAARTGTALEINAFPDRLDLRDDHVSWARRKGARFAIDTDSHAPGHLALMRFGVGTAQRGWAEAPDVINTWPLAKLRTFLEKRSVRAR